MELVSPEGQKVTLVGPSAAVSPSTSLVLGWDIQFLASTETAIPDLGYSVVWDNLQTWVGLVTYVGKYYPHLGNLEDFNMGPVNGTWTLNIIDEAQFGEGHIYCLGLHFCDDTGIDPKSCALVGHSLVDETIQACEGDPILNLDIEPELDPDFNSDIYSYNYLLFEDDAFVGVVPDQDLTDFEPGSYTVCGMMYFQDELSILNGIPDNSSKDEVIAYIDDNGFCASISEDCVDVVINSIPEVVTEEVFICAGDTLFVDGVPYTESGMYDITVPQAPCDSISILDLTVHNLAINLEALDIELSCDDPTTTLNAEMTDLQDGSEIAWSTEDGNFTSKKDSIAVDIDRPGTYTFEVSLDGCVFSEDIVIGQTEDYVMMNVSANVLTCLLDSTFIDLMVSDTIDTLIWAGPHEFSVLDEDIRVGAGGIYSVEVTTIHGCELSRDIEVIDERVFPNLEILGDTLTCTKEEVVLMTTPADTLGSTFQWYNDGGNLSMDTFLTVSIPGEYWLDVVTEMGCERTFMYEVISEITEIEVQLISDSIDCANPSVVIAYTSETTDLDVLWQLPDDELLIDSSFTSSLEGEYTLSLLDDKGCSLDTFLMISKDVEIPEVLIADASFFCGDDSIQLSAQVNFDDLSFVWTKPDGTTITEESPYIYSPGTYELRVCRENGCCASDSVVVGIDNELPVISFGYGDLDCNNDTTYIIPSDTSSYVFFWMLDQSPLSVDSNIIQVVEPGSYEVVVSDESNGCSSTYSFEISSDFDNELQGLEAEVLNCVNTETQIVVSSNSIVESFEWEGPGLLDASLSPMVNLPGQYIINFTFKNGCSGTDTIEVIKEGEFPNLQGEDKVINCLEEEVTLSVEYSSMDISVVWMGPNGFDRIGTSVEVTEPGVYTAIGIASGSCKDTIQLEVFADTIPPVLSIENDGEITCADSLVMINATIDVTAESYQLLGPEIANDQHLNFEVSTPGTYTVRASGFNGCISEASVEVSQSTEFPDYTVRLDSLDCVENVVEVGFESSDADLTVSWEGPISIDDDVYTFTTSEAGNYVFNITNENGCKIRDSLFVFMDTLTPSSAILLSSNINCLHDVVTLSIADFDPDFFVEWTGPGVVDPNVAQFETDQTGDYSLIVTALNGCVNQDAITVEYDTLSPEIIILGDPINCAAGKTFLRVESNLPLNEYEWTGPDEFSSNAAEPLIFAEGTYFVTVTSENGCISTDMIEIEDERVFPEIEVEDFYLPCDDAGEQVFTSFLSEGSFVRWFGPNDFFAEADTALVFEAGQYIGIAFNEEGCTTSDTFQVIEEAIYPEFSGFSELLLCDGPAPMFAVDVEDDRSVSWSGPNGFEAEGETAFADQPGIYQLIVTGSNGCIDSMDIEVLDGRVFPDAVASLNEPFQCDNLVVFLSGEGSSAGDIYSVRWYTEDGNILQGENTLQPRIDAVGTYIIEVTNTEIGCIAYDTLLVELQEQSLLGAEVEIIEPTCEGFGNAELNILDVVGGFGPFNVFVDDFDYGERTNIPYLTLGEHWLTIYDSLGCSIDTLILIEGDGVLSVDLPSDTTMCFGDSILIKPDINLGLDSIVSIIWSANVPCDGCVEVMMTPHQDLRITVEVIDIKGCIIQREMDIKVIRPNNLPFPQIFSPNGDNINDVFYLPMTKGIERIEYTKIYDNWGGLLYHETDLKPGDDSKGWRGTVNGQHAAIAVYIVEAKVILTDGSQVVYVGDLTLIR